MKKRILSRLVSLSITSAILLSCGGQLLAAETDEAKVSPALQTHAASSIKDLISHIQQPVKQRSVTKIIVLFDDGSYQEL